MINIDFDKLIEEVVHNVTKFEKEIESLKLKKEQMNKFLSNSWWNKDVHKFLFQKLFNYNWHCFTSGPAKDSRLQTVSGDSEVYRLWCHLLNKNIVEFSIRNWESHMLCATSVDIFPGMIILWYLNDEAYWREDLASVKKVWECNEILDIIS